MSKVPGPGIKIKRHTFELRTRRPFQPDVKRFYYPSHWSLPTVKCPKCGEEMPVINGDHFYYQEFGVWDPLITHCPECCEDHTIGHIKVMVSATIEIKKEYEDGLETCGAEYTHPEQPRGTAGDTT